jgi:2-polyprenyl-6-methoxyphenol hydroxylase-like FAD-dependent oxidoreductase
MQITKREFLKRLGLGGAALATGAAFGDEYVPDSSALPEGSCGDPMNVWFGKHVFPLEHTQTDGPSCFIKDGKVYEPAKELPVFHETDVVVVGGGPAGFAAAVSAARAGSRVALVERYGSLGGLFTNGMVLIVLATSRNVDGKWDLVTRGVCGEFMERVGKFGKNFSSQPENTCPASHWLPTVDPEAAKYLMDEMVAEQKNIEMFFHCWGVDVIQDGDRVLGVVFESKEGRKAILAKQVVDCTGDADMLFKAGGDYSQITSGVSTVFRWANMDTIRRPEGSTAQFVERGNEGNPDACWSGGTMSTANGISVRDLTRIEIAQRKENWEKVQDMRATPGWERVYTSNSASQIGVRGTRLIDAEFVIGRREIEDGLKFSDCIGWCGHDGPHAAFPVPYRQLLPKKVDNLLCAGRCLGRGDTIDTFRLIAPCMMTGQAAGVAAALSAQKGIAPRALPYADLAKVLRLQGVYYEV